MFNHFTKFFSPPPRYPKLGLTGLILTAGIFCVGEAKPIVPGELYASASSHVTPKGKLPEGDGIYLYGQSPKPQQLGQEYMVFEVRQGKVRGAFYLPSSEFSCFYGSMQSGKLALTVASSPDSDISLDMTADEDSQRVAVVGDNSHIGNGYSIQPTTYAYSVALQSYYQLATVSDSDRQILKSCISNYHK